MARELEKQIITRVYKDPGARPIREDLAILRQQRPGRNDSQIMVELIRENAAKARKKAR